MPDVAYQTLGVVFALAGLALAYRSLLHDRSRGRRRCPKCWYDLRASESLTCSECGYTAKRERQLFGTRRRWKWAVPALALLPVGYFVYQSPVVRRDGWVSLVPTTAIIVLVPRADPDWVIRELYKRHFRGFASASFLRSPSDKDWLWQWQADLLGHELVRVAWSSDSERGWNCLYRTYAFEMLIRRAQFADAASLLEPWFADPDPVIRLHALDQGLEFIPKADLHRVVPASEVVNQLIVLAQDSNADVRASAARYLGGYPSDCKRIVSVLTNLMDDPVEAVRQSACASLPNLGEGAVEAIPKLLTLLDRDGPNWMDKLYALAALRGIGPAAASVLPVLKERRSKVWSGLLPGALDQAIRAIEGPQLAPDQ